MDSSAADSQQGLPSASGSDAVLMVSPAQEGFRSETQAVQKDSQCNESTSQVPTPAAPAAPPEPPAPEKGPWRKRLDAAVDWLLEQWFILGLCFAIGFAAAVPNFGRTGGWIRAEYTIK